MSRTINGYTIVEVEVAYTQIAEDADHSEPDSKGVMRSFIQVAVPDGFDVDAHASALALDDAQRSGWLDAWVENICDLGPDEPITGAVEQQVNG